jgi:hypothetical protein
MRKAWPILLLIPALIPSCEPSQVLVEFSTNAAADRPKLAIVAAKSTQEANAKILAKTYLGTQEEGCKLAGVRCDLGSITLTPNSGSEATIVALLAIGGATLDQCSANPSDKGCIMARRIVSYVDGQALKLPVRIDLDCAGVGCGEFDTCQSGKCVSAKADVRERAAC